MYENELEELCSSSSCYGEEILTEPSASHPRHAFCSDEEKEEQNRPTEELEEFEASHKKSLVFVLKRPFISEADRLNGHADTDYHICGSCLEGYTSLRAYFKHKKACRKKSLRIRQEQQAPAVQITSAPSSDSAVWVDVGPTVPAQNLAAQGPVKRGRGRPRKVRVAATETCLQPEADTASTETGSDPVQPSMCRDMAGTEGAAQENSCKGNICPTGSAVRVLPRRSTRPSSFQMASDDNYADSADSDSSVEWIQKRESRAISTLSSKFKCSICQECFPSATLYKEHRSLPVMGCEVCMRMLCGEDQLKQHQETETHHYPCSYCSKVLHSSVQLLQHQAAHGGAGFLCLECHLSFLTNEDFHQHNRTVHKRSSEMPSVLAQPPARQSQKRKKWRCNYENCGKVFTRSDKLKRHETVHTREKRYTCRVCTQTFARSDNLNDHTRTHTGAYKYVCVVCGKGYYGPKKLILHMEAAHGLEQQPQEQQMVVTGDKCGVSHCSALSRHTASAQFQFPCLICGRSFASTTKQEIHMSKVHGSLPSAPQHDVPTLHSLMEEPTSQEVLSSHQGCIVVTSSINPTQQIQLLNADSETVQDILSDPALAALAQSFMNDPTGQSIVLATSGEGIAPGTILLSSSVLPGGLVLPSNCNFPYSALLNLGETVIDSSILPSNFPDVP